MQVLQQKIERPEMEVSTAGGQLVDTIVSLLTDEAEQANRA